VIFFRSRSTPFDWNAFGRTLTDVDWAWLSLSIFFILLTYLGRALRWEVMLRPIRPRARLWNVFTATIIGFTAVVFFGRAGELVRPYLIAKKEDVSFASQAAAWFIERILDMLMVLVIFGIALSQVNRAAAHASPRIERILQIGGYTAGTIALICLAALITMRYFAEPMQNRLLSVLGFLPPKLYQRIRGLMASFSEGLQSTQGPGLLWKLIGYSFAEWFVVTLAFLAMFRAFPPTRMFSVTDSVIFLGFVAFGSAVQIPGVGGGMQLTAVLVLTELFGLTLEVSTGLAVLVWIMSWLVVVPFGVILALSEGIRWGQLRHIKAEREGSATG
jgi:uncharacterized protein (TIRG00374 family)